MFQSGSVLTDAISLSLSSFFLVTKDFQSAKLLLVQLTSGQKNILDQSCGGMVHTVCSKLNGIGFNSDLGLKIAENQEDIDGGLNVAEWVFNRPKLSYFPTYVCKLKLSGG